MPTYKTPGVYVEEISKLPASVAEVETAIPAFIGYTEKAERRGENLKEIPTRLNSLVDFELYFGGTPPYEVVKLNLDETNNLKDDAEIKNKFYMYDSLRMFFKNGGSDCYIVSVGFFKDNPTPTKAQLSKGIGLLRKFDEPTLIVIPDATLTGTPTDLYDLQKDILAQCNDLGDRFGVFDTFNDDVATDVDNFRDGIGMNFLKYGSAYYPWLKSSLPKTLKYRDIKGKITKNGTVLKLNDLTTDAPTKVVADEFDKLVDDAAAIRKTFDLAKMRDDFLTKYTAFFSENTTAATKQSKLKDIFDFYYANLNEIDHLIDLTPHAKKINNAKLLADTKAFVATLKTTLSDVVVDYDLGVKQRFGVANAFYVASTWKAAEWAASFPAVDPAGPVNPNIFSAPAGTAAEKIASMNSGASKVKDIFEGIYAAAAFIVSTANSSEDTVESAILEAMPTLRNLLSSLANVSNIVPPSGAIVGIMAAVDRDRGVWKAPANVSLNYVAGITQDIDDNDQESLNVDVNAGKSVNAIRKFTGRGFLVWGARTLAGNDNEWRYVPVRRFFNFVEESTKKSTSWAVFEPNDANTWVKIKSQIENFLNNLWRQGALAGAKPEHAYFVNVGLGITMTSQDILEGKLIIEIGMAAVRPAEFIILRFSHKLQQS